MIARSSLLAFLGKSAGYRDKIRKIFCTQNRTTWKSSVGIGRGHYTILGEAGVYREVMILKRKEEVHGPRNDALEGRWQPHARGFKAWKLEPIKVLKQYTAPLFFRVFQWVQLEATCMLHVAFHYINVLACDCNYSYLSCQKHYHAPRSPAMPFGAVVLLKVT